MTPDQHADRLYEAITAHFAAHGHSPSQPELARATGMSRNMVHRMVIKLEAEGRIRRIPGARRNIRLVEPPAANPRDTRVAELEAALEEARWAIGRLAKENAMLRSENARLQTIVEREAREAEAMRERFEQKLAAGW